MRLIKIVILIMSLVLVLEARKQVNANFSNLQITDFIKLVSKITKKNILITYKVNGVVNFVSTVPIYDDELMSVLISVLESKGFTLVNNGSIYEVVRSTEAAKHNVDFVGRGKILDGSVLVTQAIKVKGENVDIVAAKIRHLISKSAKMMTIKESNIILITDYPKNIETIKGVIKDIDTNNQAVIKIIAIEHAEAKKVQIKLVDISKSLFNENIASEKVKIILDDNINGIIIVGLQKNVLIMEALVKKLDVQSPINRGVQIFSLKNSDAKSVLASLTEIIAQQTYTDPALKPNVSMSEEINAIIAIGEPGIISGIKLIVDELDREKYQVYVQARIIEINKRNSEALGIKYGFDGASVSSDGGLYSLSANFGGKSITDAAETFVTLPKNLTAGFALGATLDFLQENGASESISNPSILCVNNKESSIYVGKTISISSGETTGTAGTTASYQREDIGLMLKIKPRVSSTDKVTLDVEIVLENITDDGLVGGKSVRQPETSKQEVKTQAILRHGESIIIGGLIKSYDSESESKVPFLGAIPLIGDLLFTSTDTQNEEDNLIVILTPYVIEKSEKLSQLQEELGTLAQLQKEYNDKIFKQIENEGMLKKSDVGTLEIINVKDEL